MNHGPNLGHLDRGEPMVKPTLRSVFCFEEGGDSRDIKKHKRAEIWHD